MSLNEFKWPGQDELHPTVLKECDYELTETSCIISEKSWRTNKMPYNQVRSNISILKNGEKEDLGSYRSGKNLEQIINIDL